MLHRFGLNSLVAAFVLTVSAVSAMAQEPADAQAVLDLVAAQPAPKSSAVRLKMTLVKVRGSSTYEQERTVEMFGKDTPEGVRSLLRFSAPKDVEGVALLVRENKNAPNDQWLYMPALKQEPKRISGGQQNASFLGTDFTFADLGGRDPEGWVHTLVGSEAVDGHDAWVIESTPKAGSESEYVRTKQWIRKDIKQPARVEFYDRNGLLKVLTVELFEQIDGFWIAKRTRMENVVKKTATILEVLEQKNNLEIPDDVFTTRYMKNG